MGHPLSNIQQAAGHECEVQGFKEVRSGNIDLGIISIQLEEVEDLNTNDIERMCVFPRQN